MLTEAKIIEIFVMADEFRKVFDVMLRHRDLAMTENGIITETAICRRLRLWLL